MAISVKHGPSAGTLGAASFELGVDERAEAERLLEQRSQEALQLREIDRANEIERMQLSNALQTGRLELSDELQRGRADQGFEQDVQMLGARDEFARQGEERKQKTSQAEFKKASEFAREINALEAARGKTLSSKEYQGALDQVIDKFGGFVSPKMMQDIIKNGGLMPEEEKNVTSVEEQVAERVKLVPGGAWVQNGDDLVFQKIEGPGGGLAPKDIAKLNKERQDRVLGIFRDLLRENESLETTRSRESIMREAENIADMIGSQADLRFRVSGGGAPTTEARQSQEQAGPVGPEGPVAEQQQRPQTIEQIEGVWLKDTIARAKAGDKEAKAELDSQFLSTAEVEEELIPEEAPVAKKKPAQKKKRINYTRLSVEELTDLARKGDKVARSVLHIKANY